MANKVKVSKFPIKPKMQLDGEEFRTDMRVWNRMLWIYRERVGLKDGENIVNFWGGRDMHRNLWLDALRELKHEDWELEHVGDLVEVTKHHALDCTCDTCNKKNRLLAALGSKPKPKVDGHVHNCKCPACEPALMIERLK